MLDNLQKLGLEKVCLEQMYGSAYTTAQYLIKNHPEIKKVRVVGMQSIQSELEAVGIATVGGQSGEDTDVTGNDAMNSLEVDETVKAVVVGLDTKFNYNKMCLASL